MPSSLDLGPSARQVTGTSAAAGSSQTLSTSTSPAYASNAIGSSGARESLSVEAHKVPSDGDDFEVILSTRPSCWRYVKIWCLPYLKLWDEASLPTETWCQPRRAEHIFLAMGFLWVASVLVFCYLILAMSCVEAVFEENSKGVAVLNIELKPPRVGTHYPYVHLVKQALQVVILHRICGTCMEPLAGMFEAKFQAADHMEPHGVIHFLRKIPVVLLGGTYTPRWLSSFLADHLLLISVGVLSVAHHVSLAFLKYAVYQDAKIHAFLYDHPIVFLTMSAVDAYIAILVMGFLYTTLEHNVCPKPGRHLEFKALMCLCMLLWSADFLVCQLDRYIYISRYIYAKKIHSVLAAASQIFITHSSVMMGAVLMGHSCHFTRSPDLTWSVFFSKGIPFVLGIAAFTLCIVLRRRFHVFASCSPIGFFIFARAWPYVLSALSTLGGLVVLFVAVPPSQLCFGKRDRSPKPPRESRRPTHASHQRNSHASHASTLTIDSFLAPNGDGPLNVLELVDYDSALVMLTFALAVLWNAAMILRSEGLNHIGEHLIAMGGLAAPIGLSCFALTVARKPRLVMAKSRYLWFGLFFSACMFISYQDKEDCEISSDTPQCCDFPDADDDEHTWLMCDKTLRCHLAVDAHAPQNGHGHGVNSRRLHKELHSKDAHLCSMPHHIGNLTSQVDHSVFTDQYCKELKQTWIRYAQSGAIFEAIEEEEAETASAYSLFVTLGTAASIEMYFTIFGVLFKVTLLTQHPKSDKILSLNTHHHAIHPETGENHMVEVHDGAPIAVHQRPGRHRTESSASTFTATHHQHRRTVH